MQRICLTQLTSAAAVLAQRAGALIRHVRASNALNILDKEAALSKSDAASVQDPCTVADVLSQRLIVNSLRSLFPALRVCGEEDESESDVQQQAAVAIEAHVHAHVPGVALPVLESASAAQWRDAFHARARVDEVPLDEVIVWVDPLDGTREFTEGLTNAVTVLIGVAVGGAARAGVVHQPFSGRTLCAIRGIGALQSAGGADSAANVDSAAQISVIVAPSPAADAVGSRRRAVVTTRSHMSDELKAMIDATNPSVVLRSGGCGGKVIQLIDGACVYLFFVFEFAYF